MDSDIRQQLRDGGAPEELVPELTELANEIERLPNVEPRRAWLVESRWRLLRRFDEQQAEHARTHEADRSE